MSALVLTDAGRTAMADGGNRGLRQVQLVSMQIGDGVGAVEASREHLRRRRDAAALTGSTAVDGRLAVRADFLSDTAYAVTEMGLLARVGGVGREFLFAYWSAPAEDRALAQKASGTTLVVAAVVEIVRSAAELDVTVSPDVHVAATTFAALSDTPDGITALGWARGNAAGDALEFTDLPDAAVAVKGVSRRATNAEAEAGREAAATLAPAQLRYAVPRVSIEASLPRIRDARSSVYLVLDYLESRHPALALAQGGIWDFVPSLGAFPSAGPSRWGLARFADTDEILTTVLPLIHDRAVSLRGLLSRTAAESRTGLIALATEAVADAGTDHTAAMTAALVKRRIEAAVASGSGHSHSGYAGRSHSHGSHSHSGYAGSGHSHSGYADSSHSHSGYASSGHSHGSHSHSGYASSSHSHGGHSRVTDACFALSTPVLMGDGVSVRPVGEVRIGDWLASPAGPREVVALDASGRFHDTVVIAVSAGDREIEVVCTPNHRFLTPGGGWACVTPWPARKRSRVWRPVVDGSGRREAWRRDRVMDRERLVAGVAVKVLSAGGLHWAGRVTSVRPGPRVRVVSPITGGTIYVGGGAAASAGHAPETAGMRRGSDVADFFRMGVGDG